MSLATQTNLIATDVFYAKDAWKKESTNHSMIVVEIRMLLFGAM